MNAKIMNNKSREYMIFNVFLRMNSTEVKAGTEIKKKYLSLAVCMSLSLSQPNLLRLNAFTLGPKKKENCIYIHLYNARELEAT